MGDFFCALLQSRKSAPHTVAAVSDVVLRGLLTDSKQSLIFSAGLRDGSGMTPWVRAAERTILLPPDPIKLNSRSYFHHIHQHKAADCCLRLLRRAGNMTHVWHQRGHSEDLRGPSVQCVCRWTRWFVMCCCCLVHHSIIDEVSMFLIIAM